jgi:hypothetical protein
VLVRAVAVRGHRRPDDDDPDGEEEPQRHTPWDARGGSELALNRLNTSNE